MVGEPLNCVTISFVDRVGASKMFGSNIFSPRSKLRVACLAILLQSTWSEVEVFLELGKLPKFDMDEFVRRDSLLFQLPMNMLMFSKASKTSSMHFMPGQSFFARRQQRIATSGALPLKLKLKERIFLPPLQSSSRPSAMPASPAEDLWLEEILSEQAMSWVRDWSCA
eukprot:34538-Hanusia_phi.AAC.2